MNRTLLYYNYLIRIKLLYKLNYQNALLLPNLSKIVLHLTIKNAQINSKNALSSLLALELISGQKPILLYTKDANSSFNLKKNKPISCKVTLRKKHMYLFFNKLILLNLPQVRNFQGLSTISVTPNGIFSFGLDTLLIFPEIQAILTKFNIRSGLDIQLVTTAKSQFETFLFLSSLNIPFKI